MLLLDVEKAFDCVWHDALLHKLLGYRFHMVYIKLIWFLTDRKFYVTVAGERSAECGVPSGVPQGAVLSPTLFNVFTSDFPALNDVQLALFADDLALFSTHFKADVIIDRLQSALNAVKGYYSTWRIKLNPSKTQAVFFTKRRTRELPIPDLSLDGFSIPWNDAKYLGLILDKKLTFAPHFDYNSDRVQKLTRILYPLINRRSNLSLDQKVLLYKAIFQPIILYSSVVWRICAETHKRRIQVLQNRCLKLILNAP
jgi:hypothetical protein